MNRHARPGGARSPRKVKRISPPSAPPQALEEPLRRACRAAARLSPRLPRGAALLTASGAVLASPEMADPHHAGLSLCAERAVLYRALMAGEKRPRVLLVRRGSAGRGNAGPPCGACLQVLLEFAPDLRVWWGTAARPQGGSPVRSLLPGPFHQGHVSARRTPSARPRNSEERAR
jgi:cytidine deaminase